MKNKALPIPRALISDALAHLAIYKMEQVRNTGKSFVYWDKLHNDLISEQIRILAKEYIQKFPRKTTQDNDSMVEIHWLNSWYRDRYCSLTVGERESLLCWALDFVLNHMELNKEYSKLRKARLFGVAINFFCLVVSFVAFIFMPNLIINICFGFALFLFFLQCFITARDFFQLSNFSRKMMPLSIFCHVILQAGVDDLVKLANTVKQ